MPPYGAAQWATVLSVGVRHPAIPIQINKCGPSRAVIPIHMNQEPKRKENPLAVNEQRKTMDFKPCQDTQKDNLRQYRSTEEPKLIPSDIKPNHPVTLSISEIKGEEQ